MSLTTVYVLHGLLGTAYAHFGPQIRSWTPRYRVVPIDLPGHGRCRLDAGDRYLDRTLEYVTAVVERFGAGRVVAASHLSGPLAVRLAAARPDLVSSLVLTGVVIGMDRWAFLRLLAGFRLLAAENPALAAEYERLHGPRWDATLAAFTTHVDQDFDRTALVSPNALATLAVPTLICNGSHRSAERAAALDVAAIGPHLRGLVLDGAGHIAGLDAPDAFTAAVEQFWREQERSAA